MTSVASLEAEAPIGLQCDDRLGDPSMFNIESVPNKVATEVLSLRFYDFAMVQGKLLIVNQSNKKIPQVITH